MNTLVDLGKVALTLGGVWNGATNYERLTYVLYDDDGCGYVALVNNVGVRPGTNSSVWQKATLAGKSIYQLCVDHGTFVGTEEEFVAAYNAAVTAAQEAAAAAAQTEREVAAAEALRVTAENGRVSAENGRVSAENQRVSNENARQLAETARVNEFAASKAACDAATDSATAAAIYANAKGQKADEKADLADEKATLANQKAALADAAATRCTDLNDHPMRISESTYHWEKWDEDMQQYVDTGIMATGSPYAEFDIDQTTGQLTVETDNLYCGPTFELDAANGNLELSI